jgi:ABC-type nitrate/sulfonate/bicarbonate transport system substrate-binding protein
MKRALAVLVAIFVTLVQSGAARGAERVRVLVPDRENLQFMSFWVAMGAGIFTEEGIDVDLVVPPGPPQTGAFFDQGEGDLAVLPPPVYVELIARGSPVVLVANLLENDPIELVVRRSLLAEKGLSPEMPLKERLVGLRGVRVGVAPHPPTRFRALFASQGLDADKDATMVTLQGKDQNAAFHEAKVDALYAHTPYLERAILHDDAVVLVDQCRGEVRELAHRQIHVLAARRALLETRRPLVVASARAIARAEKLVHSSRPDAIGALARVFPDRDRREIETIVGLYEPAIPTTPAVSAEEIAPSLVFFPAGMPKPDIAGVDLSKHVAPDVVREATAASPARRAWIIVFTVVFAIVLAGIATLRRVRRRSIHVGSPPRH